MIAGGGGRGAPLFSRPKPQSKGRTPGGARLTQNKGKRPLNHSKTRRGGNAKQPNVTVTARLGTATTAPRLGGERDRASSEGSASASSGAAESRTGTGDDGSPQLRPVRGKPVGRGG